MIQRISSDQEHATSKNNATNWAFNQEQLPDQKALHTNENSTYNNIIHFDLYNTAKTTCVLQAKRVE